MTFDVNWGPRVGSLGTGTIQSVVGLIDFATEDGQVTATSLTPTAVTLQGNYAGQTVTVLLTGSGFSQIGADMAPTGTVTNVS